MREAWTGGGEEDEKAPTLSTDELFHSLLQSSLTLPKEQAQNILCG